MSLEKIKKPDRNDEERVELLKDLFPEAFIEGSFNTEVLRKELNILNINSDEEFYGLTWPGKEEAKKLAIKPFTGSLSPIEDEGVNVEGTNNIFIEGENLEVLRILQKSYKEKVKLVYIDPPYNTGKDFVYEDDFDEPIETYLAKTGQADEEGVLTSNPKTNGRFHSNWLNMMYPRLRLAKYLLRKDGIMVVHIDEHEESNLELLMNSIFGEENKVGAITWDKRNPKGDSTGIAYQNERIMVYARNRDYLLSQHKIKRPKKNAEKMLKKAADLYKKLGTKTVPDDLRKAVKKYKLPNSLLKQHETEYTLEDINTEYKKWLQEQDDISGGEAAYKNIDENGEVYRPVSMAWPNKKNAPDDYFIPLIHPVTKKACVVPQRGWRNPPKTMEKLKEENKILFGKDETTIPNRKYLLKENMLENIPSILRYGGSDDKLFNELGIPFENPKPYKFAMDIIKYFTHDDDIVLDFFAGSGTTGHAVLELNEQEKTNRKFLLVQVPEDTKKNSEARKAGFNTISEITKKRLYEVSKSLKENGAVSDYGFKMFALGETNIREWSSYEGNDLEKLDQLLNFSPLVPSWKEKDVLFEFILLQGFPLNSEAQIIKELQSNKVWKITHADIPNHLFICLDEKIKEDTAQYLSAYKDDVLYLFDDALTDVTKIMLEETMRVKTL
ncbi:site-specific DNA-methyltransferase [Halobacillus sp. ACCC02827]|uniref:site-specific DNA-methyltransferase n=1 Tax=Halobacillus sp. ACCC02827 TaxID=3052090 RepID=UPI002570727F|nr:site-specific DNA-methyltransferase [Halobacillus sp. ACCC02827]WJE15975.1 site-specific DNA-methyltransferase [Halobacillus sp. ACCC02827]